MSEIELVCWHIIKLLLQAIGVNFVKMIDCYNSAHAQNIDHPEKYTLYKLGKISNIMQIL